MLLGRACSPAAALGGPPPQGTMRVDVTAFAGPVGAYLPLEKHWTPVIDGKATPSKGIEALVAAL